MIYSLLLLMYIWSCLIVQFVQVTQVSCSDPDVASSEGCFQYFTGETGTIESYGLQSSQMIANQNYCMCIRPEKGFCCIEYTPTTWDVYSGTVTDAAGNAAAATCVAPGAAADISTNQKCASAERCWQNYVLIPGAISPGITQMQAAITFIPTHAQNGNDRWEQFQVL